MSNYLEYKGYIGTVEYSSEDKLLFGKVQFVDSLLAYDGQSADEIECSFQETIDNYLEFCKEVCKSPEKSFNGGFNVRVGSELHKKVAKEAFAQGLGLNEFTVKALELAIDNKTKTVNHLHKHLIISSSTHLVGNLTASMDKPSAWGDISARAH